MIEGVILLPNLKGGGAEKVGVVLASKFVEKGLTIRIVVFENHNDYSHLLSSRIKIHMLSASRSRYALLELSNLLRKWNPSFVMSFLTGMNVLLAMTSYFLPSKITLILSERSLLSRKSFINVWPSKVLLRSLYKRAHGIIAISEGVKLDLLQTIRLSSKSIKVIYNPLMQTKGNNTGEVAVLEGGFFESSCHIVIAIGRLEEVKNFKLLIDAFCIVSARIDAKLLILGEGPDRGLLEDYVASKGIQGLVYMPGFVSNVEFYLRRSSVFVSSSLWEGFGNVILEAMSFGLPIVINDCPGGPKEILQNGRFGYISRFNDINDMAKNIIDAIKYGKTIYTDRLKDFDLDEIAGMYIDYIAQCNPNRQGT